MTAAAGAGAPWTGRAFAGAVALAVIARMAATLPAALSTSSLVAHSTSAFPLGELALFEHGGELLAELLRRNRPNPTVLLVAVLAHALLLLIPDGALGAVVIGAARSAGAAVVGSLRRLGFLFAAFAFSLVGRAAAVFLVFFFWPRFAGVGSLLLVCFGLALALGAETYASNAKLEALSGARARSALSSAFDWRRTLVTLPLTGLHVGLQLLLATLVLWVSAGGVVRAFFAGHLLLGLTVMVASVLVRAAFYRLLARRLSGPSNLQQENDETACRVPSN